MVRRGKNTREEISLIARITLKAMSDFSAYNTITKLSREDIIEWLLSHPNFKPSCVSSDVVTDLNP